MRSMRPSLVSVYPNPLRANIRFTSSVKSAPAQLPTSNLPDYRRVLSVTSFEQGQSRLPDMTPFVDEHMVGQFQNLHVLWSVP